MVAKYFAGRELAASKLNYTIIRPGNLLNETGTGNIFAEEDLEQGFIAQKDVARTIVTVLNEENTYKRSFDFVSGDTHIAGALKKFELKNNVCNKNCSL